jgi:heme/copper-type cytochrome/quinol oxidase subunit 1
MKSLPAKTAFLHKNFRDLKFELKLIFFMHLLTVVFCFLPWISYAPLYGSNYYENAFGGSIKLIGLLIFLISLAICVIFIDKLFKTKKIKLPVSENTIFVFAGIQQIILIVCAWSVLLFMSGGFDLLETRFGIVFCLLFQIFGVVTAYLLTREKEKNEVINFFHQTEEKIEKEAKDLFSKVEKSVKK